MPVMPAAAQPWNTARFSAVAMRWAAVVERVQVDVVRAAVGVAQLAARDRERRAQLDDGQHAAQRGIEAAGRRGGELGRAAEVRRRVLPAVRPGEVDELAGGEGGGQPLAGLVVDEAPARLGDGRELAQQMAHDAAPLRPPMPSERLAATASGPSNASSSASSPCSTMSPS